MNSNNTTLSILGGSNNMIKILLIQNILLTLFVACNFIFTFNKDFSNILFGINIFWHIYCVFYIHHIKKYHEYYIYTLSGNDDYYK
jgi:hypothetical protein